MQKYIAIEGPIGVGKTTLVQSFEREMSARIVLDEFDNPFLADFYRDRPSAAFKAQMYYLGTRFQQQMSLRDAGTGSSLLVTDYLFARDKIFAYLNLDDQEILAYDKLFAALSPLVPAPRLVVYLSAPREVLLERVRRRNVEFEANISEEYVDELVRAYDHFFYHYTETPLLIVNTAEIDFVQNAEDRRALQQRISTGSARGIEYYHPIRKKR
jgi:deoxyadenosine/deoxycytidine kinase